MASRFMRRCAAALAFAFSWLATGPSASPTETLVVVSDDNYPPYLFRAEDGTLQGIIRDKWALWSQRTGVRVEVRGTTWAKAQEMVQQGEADVIEALAQTPSRAPFYEFSRAPATMDARIFFHHNISGINGAESLRGFTVGAKRASACEAWMREHGVESIREYDNSEQLVKSAGKGEVRMFCMDSLAGRYFLIKQGISEEFRQSPSLYAVPFDWAVRRGRAELRDFIAEGYSRIGRAELADIDTRWRGKAVEFPIAPRYLVLLLAAGAAVLAFTAMVISRNCSLRRMIGGKAAELLHANATLRQQAARARYFETRDPLTNLANRQLLHERLERTLAWARRKDKLVGVLFIDIDRFRAVNDTFGQDAGDRLLKEVATRLRALAAPRDFIARVSGDEFVMIVPNLPATKDASELASRILAAIHHAYDLDGQRLYCTASVGISVFPYDAQQPAELIRNAGMAMESVKQHGRNNFQYYRPEMHHTTVRRLELENSLRGALEREEFELHYQPRIELASGRLSGFEALLRWRHPRHGLLTPDEFVPILEDTGLIVAVGEWVMRRACAQIKLWERLGLAGPVAVNLSARQFHQRDLDKVVARIIGETGIEPQHLELELTESLLMREPEEAARTLRRLESMGVRLAIDDFGTGYSSLAYLRRFPISALKIDRAFIQDLNENPEDAAITQAIIHLAHSLGLKVIAEGVERPAQLEFLRARGCDEMQGYLFSPPLPASELDALLTTRAESLFATM